MIQPTALVTSWILMYLFIHLDSNGNICITTFNEMQSSSHLKVRSTEALFLLLETHEGTSSAKETEISGFIEEIISMYSAGFICTMA